MLRHPAKILPSGVERQPLVKHPTLPLARGGSSQQIHDIVAEIKRRQFTDQERCGDFERPER